MNRVHCSSRALVVSELYGVKAFLTRRRILWALVPLVVIALLGFTALSSRLNFPRSLQPTPLRDSDGIPRWRIQPQYMGNGPTISPQQWIHAQKMCGKLKLTPQRGVLIDQLVKQGWLDCVQKTNLHQFPDVERTVVFDSEPMDPLGPDGRHFVFHHGQLAAGVAALPDNLAALVLAGHGATTNPLTLSDLKGNKFKMELITPRVTENVYDFRTVIPSPANRDTPVPAWGLSLIERALTWATEEPENHHIERPEWWAVRTPLQRQELAALATLVELDRKLAQGGQLEFVACELGAGPEGELLGSVWARILQGRQIILYRRKVEFVPGLGVRLSETFDSSRNLGLRFLCPAPPAPDGVTNP